MDQTESSQNKNLKESKTQIYMIGGLIVVIVALIVLARVGNKPNPEQESGDSVAGNTAEVPPPPVNSNGLTVKPASPAQTDSAGNIAASGVLKTSDNTAKGNLVVDGSKGKIYIHTARDYSTLMDQAVDLRAEGTLQKFTFLGLSKPGDVLGADVGGVPDNEAPSAPTAETEGKVTFTGSLHVSDQQAKGNYMVVSGLTKVYLKTKQDLTALVSRDVTLSASGTLANFTNASLIKK
ncbi:MAG: hypothetical protein ABI643_01580 [Candidatus Doudnabacteria bacterium]